jgi:hypothetical protein
MSRLLGWIGKKCFNLVTQGRLGYLKGCYGRSRVSKKMSIDFEKDIKLSKKLVSHYVKTWYS